MGLTNAIQIGRSALSASQLAIQVAGNNLANAATPGYARRSITLTPLRGQRIGLQGFIGTGVGVGAITRQINDALQQRLFASISDESAARESLNVGSLLESRLAELTDGDLSSQLNAFFNTWSERANLVDSSPVVVQQGAQLAGFIRQLDADLRTLEHQIDAQLGSTIARSNEIIKQLATLNKDIVTSEIGTASNNALRDRRDLLVSKLSELMEVSTIEQPNGAINVLVGSTPLVLGATPRLLALKRDSTGTGTEVSIVAGENERSVNITSGSIGALLSSRDGDLGTTRQDLETIARSLIDQINRLHATGRNEGGQTTATSTRAAAMADRSLAINAVDNKSFTDLPFEIVNGAIVVLIDHPATGTSSETRIEIDLDGLTNANESGTDDDTTLADVVAALDAIDGLSASFAPDGTISINADAGFSFSFADDTSGLLAAIGINAYFTGTGSNDIDINGALLDSPSGVLVGGLDQDGLFIANATALGIAGLQDQPQPDLGGLSFRARWQATTQRNAVRVGTAQSQAESTRIVREALEAQRAAISGVSIDEESIDLLTFQRQYQGAARLIAVADELLQTLLSIV